MKKRTLISILAAAGLVLGMFAGCSGGAGKGAASAPGGQGASGAASAEEFDALPDNMELSADPAQEITLPISSTGIELSYFAMPEPYVVSKMKGYADMQAYQEAEKRTGIKIKWREESYTDPKEKMNLMFSTGDVEDIIWDAHIHASGGAKKLLDDGLIVPLNKYIDRYAPNLKKILAETPGLFEQISTDDGRIYMFPEIRLDQVTRSNSGFVLRRDWLEKLGLKTPETIEDWYTVLKAFKTQDPNGNGKDDEIPFVSLGRNKTSQSITNFSVAFGLIDGLYVQDGTVKFGPYEPAYKDYLAEMNKWYVEGLLDPEFSTQEAKLFDAKMTDDTGGAYYGALSGNLGKYITAKSGDGSYDLVPAPMPKAPDGKIYVAVNAYGKLVPHGAAIGKNNKNIVETVKWLDWKYGQEGHDLFSWGIEGESYTVQNGQKTFTDLIMNNPDGLSWEEASAKYAGGTMVQMPIVDDSGVFLQLKSQPQQKEALGLWSAADTSLILPTLFFDEETTRENTNISSEINTYISEMYNKFVMNLEPLDNFEQFRQRLKDMGVEKYLQNHQEAYDKMYK